MYYYKQNTSMLARVLVLLLSLLLICDLSFGTLGVEARELESYALEAYNENNPESGAGTEASPPPEDETGGNSDSTEETEETASSASSGAPASSETPESTEQEESDENQDDDNQDEIDDFELSDDFGQFVESAVLTGEDGVKLTSAPVLALDSLVVLRLDAAIKARALTAILNAANDSEDDVKYEVHIPDNLIVKNTKTELRLKGKLLGELHFEDGKAFFVFNTDEEEFFGGDELEDLDNLSLEILCSLNFEAMNDDTQLTVDLSDYDGGASYVISFELPELPANPPDDAPVYGPMPFTLPVEFDPEDDFTQFVKSAMLVQNSGATSEMPDSFPLDFEESVCLRFDLHSISGAELVAIKEAGIREYAIEMPELLVGLEITPKQPVILSGATNPFGWISIGADGVAKFEFNIDDEEIFSIDTIEAADIYIDFQCTLNKTKIGDKDSKKTIDMDPYDGGSYTVTIPSNMPKGELAMLKSGSKNAAGQYDWKVTVNTYEGFEDGVVAGPFVDTTGTNHALSSPITITGKQLIGGVPTDITKTINPADFPITGGDGYNTDGFKFEWVAGSGFELYFKDPFSDGPIDISYTTKLTEAALNSKNPSITLQNDARMNGAPNTDGYLTASFPISKQNANSLAKSGKFNYAEKCMEWTVTVDTLGQSYRYLTLFDQMAKTTPQLFIRQDSVKVNNVPVTPEWKPASDGTTIMVLPIWEEQGDGTGVGNNLYSGKTILTVTYKTDIPEGYIDYDADDMEAVNNNAWLEYDWVRGIGDGTGGTEVTFLPPNVDKDHPRSVPVLKEALDYNPATRLITWKITLNSNCIDLTNITLEDTIRSQGGVYGSHKNLKYATGSLIVGTQKKTGTEEADFAADINGGGSVNFPWELDEITASFRVTTEVDDPDFLTSNQATSKTFRNDIEMTAERISSSARTVSGTGYDDITPKNNILKKSGKYDYSKHEMTWTIVVNEDKINPFPSAIITDMIDSKQTFVANSITVKGGSAADGLTNPAAGTKITQAGQELTFDLGDIPGKTITITYKTKHVDLVNHTTTNLNFTNSATLGTTFNGETQNIGVTAAPIDIPLILIDKSLVEVVKPDRSVAIVTYQVFINQSNDAYNDPLPLTDTISDVPAGYFVDVDPSSVELRYAILDPITGNPTAGGIIPDTSYISSSETNPLNILFENRTLTLTLPDEIGAVILKYDVIVADPSGASLTGNISNNIVAAGSDINGKGDSVGDTSLSSGSSGGGSLSKYLKLQVTKRDEKPQSNAGKNGHALIDGAAFGLYLYKGGNYTKVSTAVTENGIALFNMLMPSYAIHEDYYIKEEAPVVSGYKYPGNDAYLHVVDFGAAVSNVYSGTVTNERVDDYTFSFDKVALATGSTTTIDKKLAGAVFELTDTEDNTFPATTATSDGNGKVTFSGLTWGTYTLKEITPPTGYVPHTGTYTVKINIDRTFTITKGTVGTYPTKGNVINKNGDYSIVNEKGSVKITKQDSETNTTIEPTTGGTGFDEAQFALLVHNGTAWATVASATASTTKDPDTGNYPTHNGILTFYNLDHGKKYMVVETSVPTGFDEAQLWSSDEITIGNTAATIHYTRIATNTRKSVHGFSFTKVIQLYEDGKAKTGANSTSAVTSGAAEFELHRFDEGTGGGWGPYKVDGKTATAATTTGGIVTFSNLSFGQYRVYETKAPAGYALLTNPIPVVIARSADGSSIVTIGGSNGYASANISGGVTTYPVLNEKGSYKITKVDNLYPNTPNSVFAGTVFTVSSSEGTYDVTAGSDGTVTIEGLTLNVEYTFTERTATTGYIVTSQNPSLKFKPVSDGTKGAATVDSLGTNNFYNDRKTAGHSFSFKKVGTNTVSGQNPVPLEGVGFTLKFDGTPTGNQATALPSSWVSVGQNSYQVATSNSTGVVTFTDLPYGSYVVTENAPDNDFHYRQNKNEIRFSVAKDGTVSVDTDPAVSGLDADGGSTKIPYTFTNSLGSVTITKIDAVNNATIAATGISFNLYDMDTGTATLVATSPYTTAANGAVTITGLYLNKNYELREIGSTTPTGYLKNDTSKYATFTLTDADTTTVLTTGADQKHKYENARKPLYSFGFNKENFHGIILPDAKFGLFKDSAATEHITGFDSDGAPILGDSLHQIKATSDVNGLVWFGSGASTNPLPFGTYYVHETSAPTGGYVRSSAVLKVDIKPDGKYTISVVSATDPDNTVDLGGVYTDVSSGSMSSVIVKNDQYGSIKIIKTDSDNNGAKITSGSAMFQISSPDVNLSSITPAVVTTHATGLSGEVKFDHLPLSPDPNNKYTYYIEETSAPDGYKIGASIAFTLPLDGEDDPYNIIKDFPNERDPKYSFNFAKKGYDGNPLSGAIFGLYANSNCTAGTEIKTATSNNSTPNNVTFTGLKFGEYYVKETAAPSGYTINTTVLKVVIEPGADADKDNCFTITTLSDVATSAITNVRSETYSFGFTKKDNKANKALNGAVFGLYSDYNCISGSEIAIATSGITGTSTDGEVWFGKTPKGLAFDEYYVKEISPPPKQTTDAANTTYNKSNAVLKVNIAQNGTYTISEYSSPSSDVDLTDPAKASGVLSGVIVKNELLGSVTITKTDAFSGAAIASVGFTLYKGGTPVGDEQFTDSNGVVTFIGLELDLPYIIKETSHLTGYVPHADITFTPEYSVTPASYSVTRPIENTRTTTYSLEFLKQDPFGEPLNDAKFCITQAADDAVYPDDFTRTPIATVSSTTEGIDGKVKFTGLSFGRYFIWESVAAHGHQLSDVVIQADISTAGTTLDIKKVDGNGRVAATSGTSELIVINERKVYDISFNKLASNTKKGLKNAEFSIAFSTPAITDLPAGTKTTGVKSDANGVVTFENLPFGEYIIKEDKAPTNYVKTSGSFKVIIDISGTITFEDYITDANIAIATDGSTATVTNKYKAPPSPPPSSGGSDGGSGGGNSGGGGGGVVPVTPVASNPYNGLTPTNIPSFFPPDSTVTEPKVVEENPDYTVVTQRVSPNGKDNDDSTDVVTITVLNPNGVHVGEIPPPDPRDGYQFDGWYIDPEMKIPYRPGEKLPKGTFRLYAKWQSDADFYDSHNPSTGDRFPLRAVSGVFLLALITLLFTRPRL